MGKNSKPFWANNQQKLQPRVVKANPQITVTHNIMTNQVETRCNFEDWDKAISMLIDALRGAQIQKMAEKKQDVVLAKSGIILPGA